jgi:hypothetical protein
LQVREAGVLLYRLKRIPECVEQFREYLARAPDSEDAEKIHKLLQRLEQGGEAP